MALVGDLIMSARELFTDLPQVIAPPVITGLAPVAGSNNFPAETIYVIATQTNQWGESLPSVESNIILGAPSNIAVTISGNAFATGVRIYFAPVSGTQVYFSEFPMTSGIGTFTINTNLSGTQTIPQRATSWLPDTDGPATGAFLIYRWLNQGLAWAAAKNRGGLPDFGAVGTVNGQPNYVMPGYWKKIDSAWFDGYPLGLLNKNNVFRRNPVPGTSGMLIVFQATDRLMIEAWPQPDRTSNQTTLSAPMTATDVVANLTSVAGQVLGFGMYQIDSEIVNYSNVFGNQLQGLIRGMCGTTPVAHSTSAPATELNLMIAGFRVPSTYSVGQSASTLYLPPGWDEALTSYLLYRFRKAEQDEAGAKAALQEATEKLGGMSANRIIAGPRQISPYGNIGPETAAGLGSAFGGVILP
jgi:hypothetical protein